MESKYRRRDYRRDRQPFSLRKNLNHGHPLPGHRRYGPPDRIPCVPVMLATGFRECPIVTSSDFCCVAYLDQGWGCHSADQSKGESNL